MAPAHDVLHPQPMVPLSLLRRAGALICMLFFIASCGGYRKARPDLPPAKREIVELQTLLDAFNQALEEAEFDKAGEMLLELEEGVKNAKSATIMNRKWSLLASRINNAPTTLREAQKRYAIDGLVERGTEAMTQGDKIIADFNPQAESADDEADALDSHLDTLRDVLDKGTPYGSDEAYGQFAAMAQTAVERFGERVASFRWQLEAVEELADVLSIDEDAPPLEPNKTPDSIELADARFALYTRCSAATAELAKEPGFDVEAVLPTPLGELTIDAVRKLCDKATTIKLAEAQRLRWVVKGQEVVETVSVSLKAIEAAKSAAEQLKANVTAIEALEACVAQMGDTTLAGYDPRATFKGHMGSFVAAKYPPICEKVAGNLRGQRPTLEWRAAAEEAAITAKESKAALTTAKAEEDPEDRTEALEALKQRLVGCAETAVALAQKKPPWDAAKVRRSDIKAVQNTWKACDRRLKAVDAALK